MSSCGERLPPREARALRAALPSALRARPVFPGCLRVGLVIEALVAGPDEHMDRRVHAVRAIVPVVNMLVPPGRRCAPELLVTDAKREHDRLRSSLTDQL